MFKALSFFLVAFMLTSSSLGAEATVKKTFTLPEKTTVVAEWLKNHPDRIATSTNSEVISRQGNLVRLKKYTVKGVLEFTLQESIEVIDDVFIYHTKLVEVHAGDITDQQMTFKLVPKDKETQVEVEISAAINDPLLRNVDVKLGLLFSVKGFYTMMTNLYPNK